MWRGHKKHFLEDRELMDNMDNIMNKEYEHSNKVLEKVTTQNIKHII